MPSAPLTDLYDPYTFDDTDGPGCGVEGHDADCLCDVDLSLSPRTTTSASFPLLVTAVAALYERDVPPTVEALLSELLGLFEASKAMLPKLTLSAGEVAQLVDQYHCAGRHAYAGRQEVVALIRGGLDMVTVANLIGVAPTVIARLFTDSSVSPEKIVKAAMMMHRGVTTFVEVRRETGLTRSSVISLADSLGYKSEVSQRRENGGGVKWDASTYRQIIDLHSEGLSITDVSQRLGVPRNTVWTVVRRHRLRSAA